jgi:hypothetical protein
VVFLMRIGTYSAYNVTISPMTTFNETPSLGELAVFAGWLLREQLPSSVDPLGFAVAKPPRITLSYLTRLRVRRYLTSVKTTVSSRGQIVLPADFRQMDGVKPGQEFDVERLDRGDYRFVRRAARQNEGAIDWLLACPRKDFFVPIDSESTDAL